MNEQDFKTFSDFHGKNVPKAKLASLCVSLREIIEAYADGDAQIKNSFDTEFASAQEYRQKLQAVRENLKTKLRGISLKIYEERNKNRSVKMRQWENITDVFINVADGELEVHEDSNTEIERLSKLNREYEQTISDLSEEESKTKARIIEFVRLNKIIHNYEQKVIDLTKEEPKINSRVEEGPRETSIAHKGSFKIDPKTPIFKSKPDENIDTWLYKIETALQIANIPENLWLAAISNYVEGTALEIVIACREN